MADANLEMNLDALHDAIETAIKAAFPDFQTVEFYREDEDANVPTPACLLDMVEAEPQKPSDAGSGMLPALVRIEARIIMARRTAATHRAVRKAATSLAGWLYLRRFPGVVTDEVEVIAIEPDEFAPNVERFCVWRVEFVMLAFFGTDAWKNDGTVPTDAFYSIAPDIGIPNKEKYVNGLALDVTP
jgi:hypothetical protein